MTVDNDPAVGSPTTPNTTTTTTTTTPMVLDPAAGERTPAERGEVPTADDSDDSDESDDSETDEE